MGNFLDTPITDKETEIGEDAGVNLSYGLSAMQGWRAQMEDDHVQMLRLPAPVSRFLLRFHPTLPTATISPPPASPPPPPAVCRLTRPHPLLLTATRNIFIRRIRRPRRGHGRALRRKALPALPSRDGQAHSDDEGR